MPAGLALGRVAPTHFAAEGVVGVRFEARLGLSHRAQAAAVGPALLYGRTALLCVCSVEAFPLLSTILTVKRSAAPHKRETANKRFDLSGLSLSTLRKWVCSRPHAAVPLYKPHVAPASQQLARGAQTLRRWLKHCGQRGRQKEDVFRPTGWLPAGWLPTGWLPADWFDARAVRPVHHRLFTSGPALPQQRFRGMGTALCLVTPARVQCNKFRMIFVLC